MVSRHELFTVDLITKMIPNTWITDAAKELETIQTTVYDIGVLDLDHTGVFANHGFESRYLKLMDALSKFKIRQSNISEVVKQLVNPDATPETLYPAFLQWNEDVLIAELLAKSCSIYYDDLFDMFNLLPYPVWSTEMYEDPSRVIFHINKFMSEYLIVERKNFQMITAMNEVVDMEMKKAYRTRLWEITETMNTWVARQPSPMADMMHDLLIAIQNIPARGVLTLGMTNVFDFLCKAKDEKVSEKGIVALTSAIVGGMTDALVNHAWMERWDDIPCVNPPFKYIYR